MMKNVINRALAAKKKNYIIPCTENTPFEGMTALCVSTTEGMTIQNGDEQFKARAPKKPF